MKPEVSDIDSEKSPTLSMKDISELKTEKIQRKSISHKHVFDKRGLSVSPIKETMGVSQSYFQTVIKSSNQATV